MQPDYNKIKNIIDVSSKATSIAAGSLAQLSFLGLDYVVISPIIHNMIILLFKEYNRSSLDINLEKVTQNALEALKRSSHNSSHMVLGFLPLFGNIINATVLRRTSELIGWAIVLILQDDRSIEDVNPSEWEKYIQISQYKLLSHSDTKDSSEDNL